MFQDKYIPKKQKIHISLICLFLFAGLLSSCSQGEGGDKLKMLPQSELPVQIQSAPEVVRESYQFAVANPDILEKVPCYCGCDAVGHQSNYACYVSAVNDSGNVNYDEHALGCSICVDITQDVIRLTEDGKSDQEIRSYVDATYSSFGPSTDTPLP